MRTSASIRRGDDDESANDEDKLINSNNQSIPLLSQLTNNTAEVFIMPSDLEDARVEQVQPLSSSPPKKKCDTLIEDHKPPKEPNTPSKRNQVSLPAPHMIIPGAKAVAASIALAN